MNLMDLIYSQLFIKPKYPTYSFTGKTVIVTGSNVGLGLEAARHFARLNAAKVILAVRNVEAGEAAKKDIEASTKRPAGVCEVWKLDLSSFESVKEFAARAARDLDRVDALVENAGIATGTYRLAEGHESTVTVNVLSTFLLALLMLPTLEATATKFNTQPTLTIVSSEVHSYVDMKPERSAPNILAALSPPDPEAAKKVNMAPRYPISKLLEVLLVRALAPRMTARSSDKSSSTVTLNMLNPGLCHSSLNREDNLSVTILKFFLARTTEVGSRTLVHSAAAGPESHGMYMSDGVVKNEKVAKWITDPNMNDNEGNKVSEKLWGEVRDILEKVAPGVTEGL